MGEIIMVKEQYALNSRVDQLERQMSEDYRRIAEMFAGLSTRMDERFEKMEKRFDRMEERFQKMDERFEKMDERFDKTLRYMEARFNNIDRNTAALRTVTVERFEAVLEAFRTTHHFAHSVEERVIDIDQRVDRLEREQLFGVSHCGRSASNDR